MDLDEKENNKKLDKDGEYLTRIISNTLKYVKNDYLEDLAIAP